YVTLPSNGQNMFYWLVESQNNPSTDPIVLWLNGGPGCSSLGGLFTELGPFVVKSDLTLGRNPYSWNRKANIVFLESPAGVGYSSPLLSDDEYNDVTTTERAYEFLSEFFQLYENYQNRDFFITGESYAGVYIPFLVARLLEQPLKNANLKGFAIGNPFTDSAIDGTSTFDYLYSHAMVSIEVYDSIQKHCPYDILAMCLASRGCTNECAMELVRGYSEANEVALNPYNIYGDVCLLPPDQSVLVAPHNIRPLNRGVIGPCQSKFMTMYLNLAQVQEAIHANASSSTEWANCNMDVTNLYDRVLSALPKYQTIITSGLKSMIYSGDTDAVVNFMGTERWIARLNLSIESPWKAWFGPDKQLAGYTQEYTNLTFTTVKGAGHMVAATRPLHALYMFECFIYGNKLCNTFTYPHDDLEVLTGAIGPESSSSNDWQYYLTGAIVLVLAVVIAVVVFRYIKARQKRAYVAV
ncbi:serine protease family S10, partial [Thraustotheca clavata]